MYREMALKLHQRGWQTIPTTGKRAVMPDWPVFGDEPMSQARMERVEQDAYPYANIGLPFGDNCPVFAVDIDCTVPSEAAQMRELAESVLGKTPFVRIGKSPKIALFYRKHSPDKYRTVRLPKLELFAGSGSQMVIYGIHPDTNQPYTWGDIEPATHGPKWAPLATAAAVNDFLKQAQRLLIKMAPPILPGVPVSSYVKKLTGEKSELAGLRGWGYGRQILMRLDAMEPGNRHEVVKFVIGSMVHRGYSDERIRAVLEDRYVRRFHGDGTDRSKKITQLIAYNRRRVKGDWDGNCERDYGYAEADTNRH